MKLVNYSIIRLSVLVAMLFVVSAQTQAMQDPQDVVRQTVDSVVAKLRANRSTYETDDKALYSMLDETLLPALHVSRMADLILGKKVANSATALDIAGIDFIRTYRSSFALTLKEKGIDGLISDLRGKNVR